MATISLDDVMAEWAAQVHAKGGVATYFPNGPYVGQRAERYITNGVVRYVRPPQAVIDAEYAIRAQERADISAGEKLMLLENALRGGTQWLLSLPRRIVAGVVGVPSWAVTLGVIALVVYAVPRVLPFLQSGRKHV